MRAYEIRCDSNFIRSILIYFEGFISMLNIRCKLTTQFVIYFDNFINFDRKFRRFSRKATTKGYILNFDSFLSISDLTWFNVILIISMVIEYIDFVQNEFRLLSMGFGCFDDF